MNKLPNNPYVLLSIINMKLRVFILLLMIYVMI